MTVLVCVAGDAMLDIIVQTAGDLVPDDDVHATISMSAGGQAANVAAWVVHLGGQARLYAPCGEDVTGRYLRSQLVARGVDVRGPARVRHTGAVLSLVSPGRRTLASDAADHAWLEDSLAESRWLAAARWLHLSGYLLLRAVRPELVRAAASAAREVGAEVSVDLSSAAMITAYGAARFADLVADLGPRLVLGTQQEWDALAAGPARWADRGTTAVVKQGAEGILVHAPATAPCTHEVWPGPVVDVTGAGDALAAGYLVGGAQQAMRAAAECLTRLGGMPPDP